MLFDTTYIENEKIANHHGRIEYIGDLSSASNTEFYYLNDSNTVYEYKANGKSKHNYRIGYGFDITSISGWSVVANYERFWTSNRGHSNEIYLSLGYVPVDEMRFSLELDDTSNTSLEFVSKISEFDLKINSNFNFFSDIPDYSTNVLISNNF